MGKLSRRAGRRTARQVLPANEKLVDQDSGLLPDGTKVALYLSDRAVYLDEPGGVRRLSYGAMASILNVRYFEVLLIEMGGWCFVPKPVTSTPVLVNDLAHGVATDVVRQHLAAMSWYKRDVIIDGELYVFVYNPWRQGVVARWHVVLPEQPRAATKTLERHLNESIGMVEAFSSGVEPGPEWSVGSVPAFLKIPELQANWRRVFAVVQREDVVLARSTDALAADVTFLGLARGGLWVADVNLDGWEHPLVQWHDLDSIEVGNAQSAHLCSITVKEPGRRPIDCMSYFLVEDPGAAGFLERLRTACLHRAN
jgi:hypothetical protein